MERIVRPKIEDIPELSDYSQRFVQYNNECLLGTRKWQSSGQIYDLLKEELKKLSQSHCSFCDGFPLNDTSRETIEHYYPKAKNEYPEKTYEWENLFYCCDKCQSMANKHNPFQVTLRPDDKNYHFDKHFWFDPEDGFVKLNDKDDANARIFLERYGINKRPEKIIARRRRYNELFKLYNDISLNNLEDERLGEGQRYIFDLYLKVRSIV